MSGGLTLQCEQNVQKIEQYLPLLENLIHHVDTVGNKPQVGSWSANLKVRWSSALISSSIFNILGPKFFQIDNLHFELGMILFLYGAFLREWAFEVLSSDLVKSATIFRKAAGVYHYLAQEVLPVLNPSTPEGPPEAFSSISSIMSLICLADAQFMTIRKAEEKGIAFGLLSKLHYGIVQLLDEATVISHSAVKECKDISMRFFDYVSSCKMVHKLRSYRYIAEATKADGQIGFAIGLVQHALSGERSLPGEEAWRSLIKQELDALTWLLSKYEHENSFVWREKIPIYDELPLLEGKRIVSLLPYRPHGWERALDFKL